MQVYPISFAESHTSSPLRTLRTVVDLAPRPLLQLLWFQIAHSLRDVSPEAAERAANSECCSQESSLTVKSGLECPNLMCIQMLACQV